MSPSHRPPRPRPRPRQGTPKPALWENLTAPPAPGQRSRRVLFLLLALATAGTGVALRVLRSSPEPGAAPRAAAEGPRRFEGSALKYTLEAPAGWRSLEATELKAAAADLDLALEREDRQGRAFVLLESMPPDLAPDPDEYAAHLLANLEEVAPDLSVLADDPLSAHPDSGVVFHLEMINAGDRVEGYLMTLLTPRWGLRLLATAPKASFSRVQPELLRLIDSLELPPAERPPPRLSFEEARRAPTRLTRRGPSPQPYDKNKRPPPAGVQPIRYDSGPLSLQAWWLPPRAAAGKKAPALVYLHGGFAYDHGDLKIPEMFREAGFAALAPTYRGENGNPGDFELFRGELDDVIAAIRWVAARDEVDPSRIFVFGHSAGGALADLISLVPGLPVRRSGK